jgi:uncharacterized protein (DUF924 family)
MIQTIFNDGAASCVLRHARSFLMSERAARDTDDDIATPAEVLAFWRAAGPRKWFTKDESFDAELTRRFLFTYEAAAGGRFMRWEETAEGALALVIVLDQFPRNMFRGNARIYAADPLARAVADRALARGFDREVDVRLRSFFYLPFMHSENLADQERCVALYRASGDGDGLKWAEHHADIIRRFGRFPHRNALLDRVSTAEEQAFLEEGGFAG